MTTVALYPGSFDPPTNGHQDLIRRAALLADRLVVAVAVNPSKTPFLPADDRVTLLRAVAAGLPNVTVDRFDGLVVDYARRIGATLLIRGARSAGDFEYEQRMAAMNRHLLPSLDTALLVPAPALGHVSGTLVREVARLGGDIGGLVPPPVAALLAGRAAR